MEKRRFWNRLSVLTLLVIVCVGCAHNPYRKRVVTISDSRTKTFPFAYGSFCGGGYPPPKQNTLRSEQLLDAWPPIDDLDALCYAHDQCYALTRRNDITCDSAFHSLIIDAQVDYIAKGCWNLTTDMVIAFFFKNWGEGKDKSGTLAHRGVQTFLGIPTAAFWAVLKLPLRPFLKYPKEGDCRTGEADSICEAIHRFEQQYPQSLFADSQVPLNIPKHCPPPTDDSDPSK